MAPDEQIAALAARYGVSRGTARLAVYRGLHARCAELADRDADRRAGFIAAVNALCATSGACQSSEKEPE